MVGPFVVRVGQQPLPGNGAVDLGAYTSGFVPYTGATQNLGMGAYAITAAGFTGPLTGNVTGNVSGSAGTLSPGRTINGVLFDGSAAITITAAPSGAAGGVLTGTYPNPGLAATTVTPTSYGGAASQTVAFTVGADGRLTAAAAGAISITAAQLNNVTISAGATLSGSSSGTNTGDITFSGQNYLSLTGQALTASAVDLSGTNATGTLAAGRFPALTGDGTTVAGALAFTLATVNSNVGTFGDATHSAQTTVNGKGIITAISSVAITGTPPGGAAGGDLTGTYPSPTIKADVGLTGNPTATTQATSDNSTRIATDAFVQAVVANAIAGVNPAVAVQAATTSAANTSGLTYSNGVSGVGATLTGTVNTAITWDGYTFTALGQRGLIKNDTQSPSGAFNGMYYVTQVQTALLPPILTRALDYDQPSDINNTGAIPVVNGTVNGGTSWLLTSTVTTVGTDPLTYTQFSINPANIITTSTSAGGDLSGTYPNPNLAANQKIRAPGITIDGGGSVPATGSKGFFTFPYAATIVNWYLAADQSGSCVIDLKRSGTSIVGSGNFPTLSSQQSANAAVSGWTSVSIAAGDIIEYNLNSATTITRVTLSLKVNAL